ncbi:MAG TPA: endonuclease domain-containing protein [Methyloceanibacter sp.]|jgi:very-short-patch-repair endonuclease|nr:endonuclease domain-containing protein [Methyloceanibacter sp.]
MKQIGTHRARSLRADLTDAERKLWYQLRDRRLAGWKFRRQVPVGPWIVDFLCKEKGVVVEFDGGQHNASERDRRRDAALARQGYRVLRFWNSEVLQNQEGVLTIILSVLESETAE